MSYFRISVSGYRSWWRFLKNCFYWNSIGYRVTNVFQNKQKHQFLTLPYTFSYSWLKKDISLYFCIRLKVLMRFGEKIQAFTDTKTVIEVHTFSQTSKINDSPHFRANFCNLCSKPVKYWYVCIQLRILMRLGEKHQAFTWTRSVIYMQTF